MPITDPIDLVRLELGDLTNQRSLFTDDEIQVYLDLRNSQPLYAAADLCEVLATRFAADYDFKWKDRAFSRSQMAEAYAARAVALRERAIKATNGGVGVLNVQRAHPHRLGVGLLACGCAGTCACGFDDGYFDTPYSEAWDLGPQF